MAEISYTRMSLALHPPQAVAALIQASAPELFEVLFGRKTLPILTAFIQRSDNRFSSQYIQVAELPGATGADRVVGMAVLVPAAVLQDHSDDRLVLTPGQRLWQWLLERLILDRVVQHEYPAGSFYLANLAVRPDSQNRGIGTQLLKQCLEAVPSGCPLYISVDIANPRAQKLYESLGFQVVSSKTLRLLHRTIGSRVLVRSA